jgi:hypothetical protein
VEDLFHLMFHFGKTVPDCPSHVVHVTMTEEVEAERKTVGDSGTLHVEGQFDYNNLEN